MVMPFWLPPLLAAPFAGSLLGVLIHRLPRGAAVAMARSECESCRHVLAPPDLVPVLSFLIRRGRCRYCNAAIAPYHLGVELAALAVAAAVVAAGLAQGADPAWIWASCGLGWTLLALGWIDAQWLVLPDALTLPLVVAGLCVAWALTPAALAAHALGAVAGYALFRLLAAGYRRLRGRDGLGAGDAKLLAAAGAWAGIAALPAVMLGAALLGIAAVLLRRLDRTAPVPFGPAIAAALFLAWLLPPGLAGGEFS